MKFLFPAGCEVWMRYCNSRHSAWYIANSQDTPVVMIVVERVAPVNPSLSCSGVTYSVRPSLMLAPSPLQLHLLPGVCYGWFTIWGGMCS